MALLVMYIFPDFLCAGTHTQPAAAVTLRSVCSKNATSSFIHQIEAVMDRKRTVRVLNKAMLERPRWAEAVLPAHVGKEGRCIEVLRACANGDIYYYGNLIGNDDEIAPALIDIVNSHEKTLPA